MRNDITCWPIYIGDICNMKCVYCACEHDSFKANAGTNLVRSINEVYDLINHCKEKNFEGGISFEGGDFSVYPHMDEVLKYTQSLGIKVTFTTNGLMFAVDKFAQKIYDYGIREINISIHTYKKEVYNEISGGDFFDRAIKGWKNAVKKGIEVNINFMMMNKNVNDALGFFLYSLKNNTRHITLSIYFSFLDDKNEKRNDLMVDVYDLKNNISKLVALKINLEKKSSKKTVELSFFNIPLCFLDGDTIGKQNLDTYLKTIPENTGIAASINAETIKKFENSMLFYEFYKAKKCSSCRYNKNCRGIPKIYIEKYSEDILEPYE